MRKIYAGALYKDGATLDDLREAVTTLEEIEPIARRVLGGSHPSTKGIECKLRDAHAQAALRAGEETKLAALRAREETHPSGGA